MACPFGSGYAWVRFAPSRVRDQATPIPHARKKNLNKIHIRITIKIALFKL
jgi:hypothetical protein